MYYRRIETDAKAMAQHNHGLREAAAKRLAGNTAKKPAAKKQTKQAE